MGGCNGLKICWLTFPTVLGLADLWDGFSKRSGTLKISWLSFPIALGQRRSRPSTAAVRRWPAPSPLVGFLVALRWLPGGFPVRLSGRSGRPPGPQCFGHGTHGEILAQIAVSRPLRIGRTFSFGIRCGMSETSGGSPNAGFNAGSVISY